MIVRIKIEDIFVQDNPGFKTYLNKYLIIELFLQQLMRYIIIKESDNVTSMLHRVQTYYMFVIINYIIVYNDTKLIST